MTAYALPLNGDQAVRNRLTAFYVAAAVSVVLLYRQWPAAPFWLPAALGGIALAIWHGAYDTVLAAELWQPRYAGKWLLPFVSSYVALAAAVLVAWFAFPVAAMVAFLLYSGLHFGTETERGRGALATTSAIAAGSLPIAAACHWQAEAVLPVFASMLRGDGAAADKIIAVAGALLVPCLLLAIVPAWRNRGSGIRRSLLVVSQVALFRVCPPVLAFAVFFCLLHTPEHLIETSRTAAGRFSVDRMWRNLRAGTVPWLISLAGVAIAAWAGRRSMHAYTASVFIALSALTVPHMALALLTTARSRRSDKLPFRSAQRALHP